MKHPEIRQTKRIPDHIKKNPPKAIKMMMMTEMMMTEMILTNAMGKMMKMTVMRRRINQEKENSKPKHLLLQKLKGTGGDQQLERSKKNPLKVIKMMMTNTMSTMIKMRVMRRKINQKKRKTQIQDTCKAVDKR